MKSESAEIDEANRQIEALEHRARKHMCAFDGQTVCWRVFGTGSPLVLLHGGSGNWLHWVRNIEVLATRFSVWVPDLPGYGESNTVVPANIDALVDATGATLDALIGESTPIDLIGFSFGALVAAHLATRRRHIQRLALLGPVGHGGPRRMRGEMRSWQKAPDDAALRELMHHNLATLMLHEPASIDALALQVHTEGCRRTRFRSKEISRAGGLADLLKQFPGPLLLMWGEHEVTADPLQLAPILSAGRTNGQTRILADAGHWVQFERADAVNRLLLDWLRAAP
jgi:pimeloyl-ACP methyl ester carboxylesterase